MSSRPFFLLPLCFVSALALNAYAALDPTGVYQDYLEKLVRRIVEQVCQERDKQNDDGQ